MHIKKSEEGFFIYFQRSTGNVLTHTVGQALPLMPFTFYSLRGQVCTQGGCTRSPPILVQTKAAKPMGQGSVQVNFANSSTLKLTWDYPKEPNGDIIK